MPRDDGPNAATRDFEGAFLTDAFSRKICDRRLASSDRPRRRRTAEVRRLCGQGRGGDTEGGVVEVRIGRLIADIGALRKYGLIIMMSMKDARIPVSVVEDAAVPPGHLADYTDRLSEVFRRHGTEGCLHVRPDLNLRLEKGVKAMRAIAEAAFDPDGCLDPGKIVDAPRMDDRALLRYPADYRFDDRKTGLDWSAWPGASGGFQGAIAMCNNNGACRKLSGGVMCPSYRLTRDERDVTRGRANTLRLAFSGKLGKDALLHDDMAETLKLVCRMQGLPARMSDRHGHGARENQGAVSARADAWLFAQGSPDRRDPALCPDRSGAARGCSRCATGSRPSPLCPRG